LKDLQDKEVNTIYVANQINVLRWELIYNLEVDDVNSRSFLTGPLTGLPSPECEMRGA